MSAQSTTGNLCILSMTEISGMSFHKPAEAFITEEELCNVPSVAVREL